MISQRKTARIQRTLNSFIGTTKWRPASVLQTTSDSSLVDWLMYLLALVQGLSGKLLHAVPMRCETNWFLYSCCVWYGRSHVSIMFLSRPLMQPIEHENNSYPGPNALLLSTSYQWPGFFYNDRVALLVAIFFIYFAAASSKLTTRPNDERCRSTSTDTSKTKPTAAAPAHAASAPAAVAAKDQLSDHPHVEYDPDPIVIGDQDQSAAGPKPQTAVSLLFI